MNPKPFKISVITVTLNAATALQKTLESIICQDWPDREIIVIDGGSKDETQQVIEKFSGHISYWISEPDRGIYDAMNKGLAHADGEWVNFMNAGDVFFNRHVLSTVFDRELEEAQVLYGDSIASYPDFRARRKARPAEDLWKGMICCHQAMFVRTNLIKNDGFKPGLFFSADYEMIVRLYVAGNKFRYIPEILAIFDTRGMSNQQMVKSARSNKTIWSTYHLMNRKEKRFHRRFICQSKITEWIYRVLPSIIIHPVQKWIYRNQIVIESLHP